MKLSVSFVALALFAMAGVVQAHAHLHKSTPENNATITTLPENLVLEFNEQVKLTALTIQQGDGKAQDLGPLPATAAKTVTVAMPKVGAGDYIVKWRAMSDDNHIMSGKVLFKLAAK